MLLYTLADASKAWEAEHSLAMDSVMGVLCWLFVPAVVPFIRPLTACGGGKGAQRAGLACGILADYTLLIGTLAFAALGVLLFLSSRGGPWVDALFISEAIGCWGFLLSALGYFASWVGGTPPVVKNNAPLAAQAEDIEAAVDNGGQEVEGRALLKGLPEDHAEDANASAATVGTWQSMLLSVTTLEWWGHILNIAASLVYVLASTSGCLLQFAPPSAGTSSVEGGGLPLLTGTATEAAPSPSQQALRLSMAQTFVVGDILWTLDAVVFLGIWAREAWKREGRVLRLQIQEQEVKEAVR
jgi:hypothetical protein